MKIIYLFISHNVKISEVLLSEALQNFGGASNYIYPNNNK